MSWWWAAQAGGPVAGIAARLGLKASVKTQVDAGVSHVVGLRTSIGIEKDSAAPVTAPVGLACSVATGVTPPPLPIDPDSQSHLRLISSAEITLPNAPALDPTGDLELRFTFMTMDRTPPSGEFLIHKDTNWGQYYVLLEQDGDMDIVIFDNTGAPRLPTFELVPSSGWKEGQWRQFRIQIDVDNGGNTTVSLYERPGLADIESNVPAWVLSDSQTNTGVHTWHTSTSNLRIGSIDPTGTNFINGMLRDFVGYHSLTQTSKFAHLDLSSPRFARPNHEEFDFWMDRANNRIWSVTGTRISQWWYEYRPIEFAMSDYLEQLEGDQLFRDINLVTPEQWLALYTVNPTDADVGTEVSAPSYQRVRVFSDGATPPYWTGGVDGLYWNQSRVQFPVAGETWGEPEYLGIRDASSGGNLLFHAPMPKISVGANGLVEFDVTMLRVQLR